MQIQTPAGEILLDQPVVPIQYDSLELSKGIEGSKKLAKPVNHYDFFRWIEQTAEIRPFEAKYYISKAHVNTDGEIENTEIKRVCAEYLFGIERPGEFIECLAVAYTDKGLIAARGYKYVAIRRNRSFFYCTEIYRTFGAKGEKVKYKEFIPLVKNIVLNRTYTVEGYRKIDKLRATIVREEQIREIMYDLYKESVWANHNKNRAYTLSLTQHNQMTVNILKSLQLQESGYINAITFLSHGLRNLTPLTTDLEVLYPTIEKLCKKFNELIS
jgi:hypothetical protein